MYLECGIYRTLQIALLAASLMLGAAATEAQSPVKEVLILQSLDRGNIVLDQFTTTFRAGLSQRAGKAVNIVQVVVGRTGFIGASDQAAVDYIRAMYADRGAPQLIVTIGGPAAAFGHKYRSPLFPATPLLLASVDSRWLGNVRLHENETAVAISNDYPEQVAAILGVLPETKHIFVVVGAGQLGQFWRRQLEADFERFRGSVTFDWSNELSLAETLHRSASLPRHSAILFLDFSADARGGSYASDEVVAALYAAANAPIFEAHTPLLGRGIVGGALISIEDLGRRTSDVAARILNGEPPAHLRGTHVAAKQPMFDWRQLERWGIPESRLPPGSIVRYRPPTLWEEHTVAVLAAASALVIQSLLIALLLYARRARRRAELESRRNLALAADANRRATISTLATSIGHELAQPLSAIMYNTQALQALIASNQVTPFVTAEILADINAGTVHALQIVERHKAMLRSHELQKRAIDLDVVVNESLALVAHDMRARHIDVRLDLSATSCVVDGDQVLLAQVLVNLLRNAMDALADTPPTMRRVTIRSAITTTAVELSVSDTGRGLPAATTRTLFTPFVTTKVNGLGIGLTIVHRIVEAHGGTIIARGNENGGATFTVRLPRIALRGSVLDTQVPAIRREAAV